MDDAPQVDVAGLESSVRVAHVHVDQLVASGIDERNVSIVGFSQAAFNPSRFNSDDWVSRPQSKCSLQTDLRKNA